MLSAEERIAGTKLPLVRGSLALGEKRNTIFYNRCGANVMDKIASLRTHLINLLTKGEAHIDAASELKGFTEDLRGKKPQGSPHTPWQLLEHMRLGQWDILRFSVDAKHVSPKWPEGYWPETDAPPDARAWDKSVRQFLSDLEAISKLVRDPKRDLLARIP